jgi:endonuclease/exonuclease/phosphatase family metal-dependent hydrolase
MHEMQGPHVAGQRADQPIPRPARVLPGPPPSSQSSRGTRSPGFRTTLGVAPAADFVQVVREFLLPPTTDAQGHSLILFKNLSPSTECTLLSPHHRPYPPDIHSDMHKLGVRGHESRPDPTTLRPRRSGHDRLADIDEFTVASLNLHSGVGLYGQPFDVAAALCQLEADVICVQEAWPRAGADDDEGPVADWLAEAAGELEAAVLRPAKTRSPGRTLASWPSTSIGGELAVVMPTALSVIGCHVIELGRAPGDAVARFGQVVILDLGGGTKVRIVNTHLTYRLTSPLQLRALRKRLRDDAPPMRRLPTIVAGDLNMPRPFAAVSIADDVTVRGSTWPANRPFIQLDHILVDQRVKVIRSEVLPTVGSDHLPVRARLRVLPSRQIA